MAGPLNPILTRTTNQTITTTTADNFSKTLSVSSITKSITGTATSNTSGSIVESFAASFLPSFAVSVTQNDASYTSPNYNDGATGDIAQSVTASNASGITQAQTTAGNANVTVASNALYSGAALLSVTSTINSTLSGLGGMAATLAVLPGFALQNSNAVATMLLASQVAGLGATTGLAGYGEISQSGINEYSPHHNEGVVGGIVQTISAINSAGITQMQTQAGNANVQAAHNVILYNASAASVGF
jgi:hypothetical protein